MSGQNLIDLVLLWVHLLAMVGAFGALYLAQNLLLGAGGDLLKRALASFNKFIAVGFIAGLALYYIRVSTAVQAGFDLGAKLHGTIGVKFLLLLAAGGCAAVGGKKARGGHPAAARGLNFVALLALAVATLMGLTLRLY